MLGWLPAAAEKAAVAVAHSILIIVYHLLTEGTVYHDLGGNYFAGSTGGGTSSRPPAARVGLPPIAGIGRLISREGTVFSDQAGALWEPESRTIAGERRLIAP